MFPLTNRACAISQLVTLLKISSVCVLQKNKYLTKHRIDVIKMESVLVVPYRHGSCLFCNPRVYVLTTEGEEEIIRVVLNLGRVDVSI